MKKGKKMFGILVATGALFYATESCQKSVSATGSTTGSVSSSSLALAIDELQAIAVGSTSSSLSVMDSVYVIRTCERYDKKDTIAFAALPANVTNYLNANYAGYTAMKAFAVTDSTGAAAGYIVIIQYNGVPVGLKFDASGSFVSVLEQRRGSELQGCMNGSDSTHLHSGHPFDSTHVFDSTYHGGEDSTHHHHEHGDSTSGH